MRCDFRAFYKSIHLKRIVHLSFKRSLASILFVIPVLSYGMEETNLRNVRYCEIILAKTATIFSLYNTLGLNDCPKETWDKITVEGIQKETGSTFARLNGPRYWIMDGFINSDLISNHTKTFNGLSMREVGELLIDEEKFFTTTMPYQTVEINRKITWVYDAGKPIFELIDSKGHVFLMHSYSIQKVKQNEETLSLLGSKLSLPPGWQFKTGILKKAITVQSVNDKAVMVQDNYFNTYQKAEEDFLK